MTDKAPLRRLFSPMIHLPQNVRDSIETRKEVFSFSSVDLSNNHTGRIPTRSEQREKRDSKQNAGIRERSTGVLTDGTCAWAFGWAKNMKFAAGFLRLQTHMRHLFELCQPPKQKISISRTQTNELETPPNRDPRILIVCTTLSRITAALHVAHTLKNVLVWSRQRCGYFNNKTTRVPSYF